MANDLAPQKGIKTLLNAGLEAGAEHMANDLAPQKGIKTDIQPIGGYHWSGPMTSPRRRGLRLNCPSQKSKHH